MNLKSKIIGLFNRIRASRFLKSVFTLTSGTVIAQGINFLGMPIVGRVYSPAAMGDYALITANANVISAIACLGMMTSIMLPKEDDEAKGLVKLITTGTLSITTIIILGLWFVSPFWKIFSTVETPYYVGLIVLWLYIVFNIVSSLCYGYINRKKLYRAMFWNPIIGGVINVVAGIAFGVWGWGFVGYTMAHVLSLIVNIIHMIWHANPFSKYENKKIKYFELMKEYKRFPIFQMPANLVSNLSNQIPMQLMETLYSATSLGMYSMALKILSIPSTLLAVPINRVYYQEANQRYNDGEDIGEFSFKIIKTNIKIAMIPIGLIIILGPLFFQLFLGEQWREAGKYASIMGVYQLMLFCAGCLSGNFVIIRKNTWNLISSISILAVDFILVIIFNIITAPLSVFLITLCLTMTIHLIVVQGFFLVYTGVSLVRYIGFIVKYVAIPYIVSLVVNILIY